MTKLTPGPLLTYCGARIDRKKHIDVVLYCDKETKHPVASHPWYSTSKPDRRNKFTMLNCARYRLQWL